MIAIIGLGNPGARFARTRHNIGFMVVDQIADESSAPWQSGPLVEYARALWQGMPVLLVKPQTYMNESGKILSWLKKQNVVVPTQVIVIHDDIDLPFGKVLTRQGGSARGQNGVKSCMQHFGEQFWRVRCGVDRPVLKEEVPNYVLSNFTQSPQEVSDLISKALTQTHTIAVSLGR